MRPHVLNVQYRVKLVAAHFTLNKRISFIQNVNKHIYVQFWKKNTSCCLIMSLFFTKIFGQSWSEVPSKYYPKKIDTQHCHNDFIKPSNFFDGLDIDWSLKDGYRKTAISAIACLGQPECDITMTILWATTSGGKMKASPLDNSLWHMCIVGLLGTSSFRWYF